MGPVDDTPEDARFCPIPQECQEGNCCGAEIISECTQGIELTSPETD